MKQDRWVEVTGNKLIRSTSYGGAPRGTIDLDRVVTTRNPDGVSFTLQVGCKTHTFIAEDASICDVWMRHIAAASEHGKGGEAPPAPAFPVAG